MSAITIQQTPHGPIYAAGGARFHSPDGLNGLGGDPLRDTLTEFAERSAPLDKDMLPARIASKRLELFGSTVLRSAGEAINAARLAKSDAISADARLRQPVRDISPALAVETRQTVARMDAGQQVRYIESAGLDELTALVADGNRAGLPDPILERAQERFWLLNWSEAHNVQGEHPAVPDTETVLATGPDPDKVMAAARAQLDTHRARMDGIADAERAAKQLVAFLAAAFDIAPQDVINRAMGRASAAA